jgi:hypothetical protein
MMLGMMVGSASRTSIAAKWGIGSYRHAIPYPAGNLYLSVRKSLGLSQAQAAHALGCSTPAWRARERSRRNLCVAEILALHELSGLSDTEFMKLLNDIA